MVTDKLFSIRVTRLGREALSAPNVEDRRADALGLIGDFINGAHFLARQVMSEDEMKAFLPHLESALAALDGLD